MADLTERLRQAATWVERQDEPAPDWDALLIEAADRIEQLNHDKDLIYRMVDRRDIEIKRLRKALDTACRSINPDA